MSLSNLSKFLIKLVQCGACTSMVFVAGCSSSTEQISITQEQSSIDFSLDEFNKNESEFKQEQSERFVTQKAAFKGKNSFAGVAFVKYSEPSLSAPPSLKDTAKVFLSDTYGAMTFAGRGKKYGGPTFDYLQLKLKLVDGVAGCTVFEVDENTLARKQVRTGFYCQLVDGFDAEKENINELFDSNNEKIQTIRYYPDKNIMRKSTKE